MSFREYCCSPDLKGGTLTQIGYRYYECFYQRWVDGTYIVPRVRSGFKWTALHVITGIVVYPIAVVGLILGSIVNIVGYPWMRFWTERNATHFIRQLYGELKHNQSGMKFTIRCPSEIIGETQCEWGIIVQINKTDENADRESKFTQIADFVRKHYPPHFTQFRGFPAGSCNTIEYIHAR